VWDYLNFADTSLGEPESNELVVETLLKSLCEGKYPRLDGARLTFNDVSVSANPTVMIKISLREECLNYLSRSYPLLALHLLVACMQF
jgi:hypothetical protein